MKDVNTLHGKLLCLEGLIPREQLIYKKDLNTSDGKLTLLRRFSNKRRIKIGVRMIWITLKKKIFPNIYNTDDNNSNTKNKRHENI